MALVRRLFSQILPKIPIAVRCISGQIVASPSDQEVDKKFEDYFNRPDIDGWEVRKAMSDMHGMDMVPEPKIITAAVRACRRVNDYALAVRYLESVRFKCGPKVKTIWPYIVQEIKPTLEELGVDLPEELGYDKPELYLMSVFDPYFSEPVKTTPKN